MKTYYLDYCTEAVGGKGKKTYLDAQRERFETFPTAELDTPVQWGYANPNLERNVVDTDFYQDVKSWFDNKSHGYWAWKPFIIYDLLSSINDGDIVVYWDCHPKFSKFTHSLGGFTNHVGNNLDMVGGVEIDLPHTQYTKRDCFELMGCTDTKYLKRNQIQASWSIWKKTSKTMKIVEEWLHWCKNENVVRCDLPNICGKEDYGRKVEHRWDQSILTNVLTKNNCNIVTDQIFPANLDDIIERRRIQKNLLFYGENFKNCVIQSCNYNLKTGEK